MARKKSSKKAEKQKSHKKDPEQVNHLTEEQTQSSGKSLEESKDLMELPNEIWLNVFEFLDYFSLKICQRVSRDFQSFDAILFRGPVLPKDNTIDLNPLVVHLHRCLDVFVYDHGPELESVFLRIDGLVSKQNLVAPESTSAATEYATSPAVPFILFKMHPDLPPFQVSNQNGVTVLHVQKALCRFLKRPNKWGYTIAGIMMMKLMEGEHELIATYGNMMTMDPCGGGWGRARLDARGRLILTAYHCLDF